VADESKEMDNMRKALLVILLLAVVFEASVRISTGSFYGIPFWNAGKAPYTVTWTYQDVLPQLTGKPIWMYVIVDGRSVEETRLNFTPSQIAKTTPSPVNNEWLQAPRAVVLTGKVTIGEANSMVAVAYGKLVFSQDRLRSRLLGVGWLLTTYG
jgi:hypothetical protein